MQTRPTTNPFWVPILLYHRVVPILPAADPFGNCVSTHVFESQLRWLSTHGYRSVPLSTIRAALKDGDPFPKGRTVVITFDDGYQDNYDFAWPLLQRYGFTATIFLVSDAVDGDNSFDQASGAVRAPMLSMPQIREMAQAGIGFGSHSCSHPATLTALSDADLRHELVHSRAVLEGLLDAPVSHFAYPHSQLDARVEATVTEAGYELACAGVGTRFAPTCLHRVEPGKRRGLLLKAYLAERRLKWRLRQGT